MSDVELNVDCPTPAHTERLAGVLAAQLGAGDLVILSGDLGAGKTTVAQHLAKRLGVTGDVTSPTFGLLNIYPTPAGPDLCHADLYRLETVAEVEDLGIPELVESGAIVLVEWGERAAPLLGATRLEVDLSVLTPGARNVALRLRGGAWSKRAAALARALEAEGLHAEVAE